MNLLSVSQIISNGVLVKFKCKGWVKLNKPTKIARTARLINKKYRLYTYTKLMSKIYFLWHQSAGHLNFQDSVKVVENIGVQFSKKVDKIVYMTCLEGIQTR